jgi:hypothetical protein
MPPFFSRMARSLSAEAGRVAVLATEDGYRTGSGPSALTEPEVVRQPVRRASRRATGRTRRPP